MVASSLLGVGGWLDFIQRDYTISSGIADCKKKNYLAIIFFKLFCRNKRARSFGA
jgi:hypothetical protein